MSAVQRNMCKNCNETLGGTLESDAQKIISPLAGRNAPFVHIASGVECLTPEERKVLTIWCALRALQFSIGHLKTPIHQDTRTSMVSSVSSIMTRTLGKIPSDFFLDAGYAAADGWNLIMSPQLRERHGNSMQIDGSFLFGLQVNRLLLVLASIPGKAFPDRSRGWGYAIYPRATTQQTQYNDLHHMMAHCRIMLWTPEVERQVSRVAKR